MSKILYSIGDSFVYGHGLKTRWSSLLSEKIGSIDINNSLTGSSNDRTFRTVIRDICRIEKYGEVWSEETGNVECTLDDILVIIGWTSPFRFEWFKDGEYYQSRLWKKDDIWKFHEGRIDYRFSDEITLPIVESVNSLIRFFNQIISLKSFLKERKVDNLFYNCFFPFGENTNNYFREKVMESEMKKPDNLRSFDNLETYYSLDSLWERVPKDYKILNHLDYIGMDNLDESLHPTAEGHKMWTSKLFQFAYCNMLFI